MDGLLAKDVHFFIGNVISIDDPEGGDRIKATIYPADKHRPFEKIPYAFPALPKLLHIKPKVGELVLVITESASPNSQRYYIGPIISQPQFAYFQSSLGATSLLRGGAKPADVPAENKRETKGAFAKDNEIAILGRKNSDIILSDDDIRVRCGVKVVKDGNSGNVYFNEQTPAFIKLKRHENPLDIDGERVESTATIVADKINLISNNDVFNVSDPDEGITDEEMLRIIENAHPVPYGDNLVKFLSMFLKMFKSHTHKYDNAKPCDDKNSQNFDAYYNADEESLAIALLSDNVKIS